ncbi:cysteine proteinase [Pluteus cervinus]|uniref:Cysteine proteinase n=1 Tax=Pluteus cervinus TaxID=181527 RepID=A0ACD3AT43_9AGAR|nr:cysteine proteinase [Pluteus cervinus]
MRIPDELRDWCIHILQSNLFQQIAPIFILFLVPFIFLTAANRVKQSTRLNYYIPMVLDGVSSILPWNWGSGGSSGSSGRSSHHGKGKGRKHIRSRAEQQAMNGRHDSDSGKESEDDGYYPGLVNISGTYCFLNSTLQALSSLSYLKPHIDAIHDKAVALDVPSPVTDALQNVLRDLNTPRSSYTSLRPLEMIDALSRTGGRTSSLIVSREHQDAQELFQLLSECVKNELTAVEKEGYRDRGLVGLAEPSEESREIGKSVFDGLTANRRSCTVCGYTEAVMHFPFDNWPLAVPSASSIRLESCLEEYTRLEYLRDCICRKCSLLATNRRLEADYKALEEATRPEANPTNSKKRRLAMVRKLKSRVEAALQETRIEDDLKDVRLEKVYSLLSTKQAMIARPPSVLALHINRSLHYGLYASRNPIRVYFPEVLDLTPFTTSGNLSTSPTAAISTPPSVLPRSTTPTPSTYTHQRIIYRLSSIVCHFGQHSFGHYICYRRKPKKGRPWHPPRLVDPLSLKSEEDDEDIGHRPKYIWEDEEPNRPGTGWLRISDDAVRECGIESVLQETSSVFMLYYERVIHSRPGIYPDRISPRGSEETLKPELKTLDLNGSVGSLVSEVGVGVKSEEKPAIHLNGNGYAVPNNGFLHGLGSVALEGEASSSTMTMSTSGLGSLSGSSQGLGPRILQRTTAGQWRRVVSSSTPNGSPASSTVVVKQEPESEPSVHSLVNGHCQPPPPPQVNGHATTTANGNGHGHANGHGKVKEEETTPSIPPPSSSPPKSSKSKSPPKSPSEHTSASNSASASSQLPPKQPLSHRVSATKLQVNGTAS